MPFSAMAHGLLFMGGLLLCETYIEPCNQTESIDLTTPEKGECMKVLERLQRTPRLGFAIAAPLRGALPAIGSHAATESPAAGLAASPGTASAANAPTDGDLIHNPNRGANSDEKSRNVSAIAPEPGAYTFLRHYSHFHLFFLITAFAEKPADEIPVDSGSKNCRAMGHGNIGSDSWLRGALNLTRAPESEAGIPLASGLLA
jgi:hypothetical protein